MGFNLQLMETNRLLSEYRRRLKAFGFEFGRGPASDDCTAPPGWTEEMAIEVWNALLKEEATK